MKTRTSKWLETYGDAVKAIADELAPSTGNQSEEAITEILESAPESQRARIRKIGEELSKNRVSRALEWRKKLGIKEGCRLVDDAAHLP